MLLGDAWNSKRSHKTVIMLCVFNLYHLYNYFIKWRFESQVMLVNLCSRKKKEERISSLSTRDKFEGMLSCLSLIAGRRLACPRGSVGGVEPGAPGTLDGGKLRGCSIHLHNLGRLR